MLRLYARRIGPARCVGLALAALLAPAVRLPAQPTTGAIHGHVSTTSRVGVTGAVLTLVGTRLGALSEFDGSFTVERAPAGRYLLRVRATGYASDSQLVAVTAGDALTVRFVLRPAAQQLGSVVVTASPRLSETRSQAIEKQRHADNVVNVLSGDDIRALPNANAAEAVARIVGVSTERDEGEGKFVQVRGTEPRLSNVTINGAHVPGTETGSRVPKLDAVPTDILAAIEVSKTLTADMDADAIGGSVNLVTKTPEGAPRGYLAGQYGQASLLNRTQSQGSLMWGGRFHGDRLGFLLGGTYDRNNRAINDLELAWSADDAGRVTPVEWDQRDYVYDRTRYGAGGDLDYRFAGGSMLALKGLWSQFDNFGTRYRYDVGLGGDSAQVANGAAGIGTGAQFVRESSHRTPREQMWGLTAAGRTMHHRGQIDYALNYAGTRQSVHDYRTSDFEYAGPAGDGLALRYDGTDRNTPRYQFLNAADATLAGSASNYALTKYARTDGLTTGRDIGGGIDGLLYVGAARTGTIKVGVKYRDEAKSYVNHNSNFSPTKTILLSQVLGSFSDPDFYHAVASGFDMGPQPNDGAATGMENASASAFADKSSSAKNALASYSGGERIAAAYAMSAAEVGPLHMNVGLRVEHTAVDYLGNVATTPGDASGTVTGAAVVRSVPGTQRYTDLFPSLQLRLAADARTNIRFAVTRGIARANYADLAPHLSGETCPACRLKFSNLSAGNPSLRPQHAWNADLLAERFLGPDGVLSGGVFYKRITDFIYKRQFVYAGPATEFVGYYGTRPENGGDGHIAGAEVAYTQRLRFLPGALSGLGFDVNLTRMDSGAELLSDTATSAATLGTPLTRHAPLARQAKQLANAALTYDRRRVALRAAWQYQGASIYAYGDGSATPSGDNWVFPHSQIDASATLTVAHDVSVQLQALNLNDAVFGFYNGVADTRFANQREYYGRSVIVGVKLGFGASTDDH